MSSLGKSLIKKILRWKTVTMVRAWYMDDNQSDQRNEHHQNPPIFVDMEKLNKLTGVEYFKVIISFITKSFNIQFAFECWH